MARAVRPKTFVEGGRWDPAVGGGRAPLSINSPLLEMLQLPPPGLDWGQVGLPPWAIWGAVSVEA